MQQDNFQEPYAKTIVIAHLVDKNVAMIWVKIVTYHDSSMVNNLRISTVSTYITSVRLHKIDFRGNLSTWILNFCEQIRLERGSKSALN